MISKNRMMLTLLIMVAIAVSSVSAVSTMDIYGGAFLTNGGLNDLTYASIDVGSQYAGDNVVIQIYYSRDGSLLNHGNMVPKTVTNGGFINVKSADAYRYYPDHATVNIYNTNNVLLDTLEINLNAGSGIQTFGQGFYDHSYIY